MEYGLLQFTAQTAELCVRREVDVDEHQAVLSDTGGSFSSDSSKFGEEMPEEDDRASTSNPLPRGTYWVRAKIHIPSGESIGEIQVPSSFFNKGRERSGELVLLSSKSDKSHPMTEQQARDYKSSHSHNIMLIEWIDNIAYRQGLTTMEKDSWAKVHTHQKNIILG
jgi:hypothetical protein